MLTIISTGTFAFLPPPKPKSASTAEGTQNGGRGAIRASLPRRSLPPSHQASSLPSFPDGRAHAVPKKLQVGIVNPKLIERLVEQRRQHPNWSHQLHFDNLAAMVEQRSPAGPMPSYASVSRYLKNHGLIKRPRRGPSRPTTMKWVGNRHPVILPPSEGYEKRHGWQCAAQPVLAGISKNLRQLAENFILQPASARNPTQKGHFHKNIRQLVDIFVANLNFGLMMEHG
jgi:hypothetical protein